MEGERADCAGGAGQHEECVLTPTIHTRTLADRAKNTAVHDILGPTSTQTTGDLKKRLRAFMTARLPTLPPEPH